MTREDIIRMAQEAGLHMYVNEATEELANLVAAAEREACAKVCERKGGMVKGGEVFAAKIRARGKE